MCNDRDHVSNCTACVERNNRTQYCIRFDTITTKIVKRKHISLINRRAYLPVCLLQRSTFDKNHSSEHSTISRAHATIGMKRNAVNVAVCAWWRAAKMHVKSSSHKIHNIFKHKIVHISTFNIPCHNKHTHTHTHAHTHIVCTWEGV